MNESISDEIASHIYVEARHLVEPERTIAALVVNNDRGALSGREIVAASRVESHGGRFASVGRVFYSVYGDSGEELTGWDRDLARCATERVIDSLGSVATH